MLRVMWTALLLSLTALAGDASQRAPVRCEAIWNGPSTGCDLAGNWAATGLGEDEDAAREAALTRLKDAMEAGADAMAFRFQSATTTAGAASPQRQSCAVDAAARVRYACFAEDALREARLCFADLPEPDCWTGDPLLLEGTAWKEMERGRNQVCREMEDQLRAANATAQQSATCKARCYQAARVRCPPGLISDIDAYADRPIPISESRTEK